VKPDAAQAFDVNEKLGRLVAAFGQNATSRLLTWDAGQMRRCLKREEKISDPIAQRIAISNTLSIGHRVYSTRTRSRRGSVNPNRFSAERSP
jgi:hypothetical protein